MTNLIHSSLYVLVLGSVFVNVSPESSTASVASTTQDVETTTHIDTSSTTEAPLTTVVDTNTGDVTTSTESDTSTSDFTTTASDFTTTDESHIDFTTSVNTDSTTTEIETTTATDPITTETTTATRQNTEITTVDESESASTTDGATTPASTTTSADVSSTKTDSLTTFTESPTSTATETTSTAHVSSTTDTVTSTSVDPDTTTPDTTTTTDLPHSPTSDATTTGPVCPTTEVIVKDDVRNYIIIALSITLGMMIIGIIIWCLLARLRRNKVSYMKTNMVSTGTQTEDYIPKELYIRPLPPIDTHMKIVSANPQSDVHTKFPAPEKHPIDIHVEVVSEDQVDTKIDIIPDSKCKPVSEKEHTTYNSTTKSTPICLSSERDSDTLSNESEYIDIPDDDMEGTDTGESSNVHSEVGYPDKDNFDSLDSRTTPLACETTANPLDSETCTEHLSGSGKVNERLFIRTSNVSELDISNDENDIRKSNIMSAGMENKRPSFQTKHCFDEDEEVEEIIVLETENKLPTVRHVTFQEPLEQNKDHSSGSVETSESDNGVTLVSSKFRGLVTTKIDTVETSPETVKINRKRNQVVRKKAPDISVSTSLHRKSQTQKRYEATYNIIAQACFKPGRTEEKVWKHLKKLDTIRKLRLKAKTKSKKNIPPAEPKFKSEPYSSLYSRLSHFES